MFKNLTRKTILITGASSAIGRSTAIEFARSSPQSLRLILTARRIEILQELAAEINSEAGDGVKILTVQLDVSKPEEIHNFVERLPEEWRDIDVLVNNALDQYDPSHSPTMLRRNKGDIINLNSIAGHEAYLGGSIYCATKSPVRSYSDALRRELIGTTIRVMEVAPGCKIRGDKKVAEKVYEGCEPLTPEDVAEVIVLAASRRENVVVADVLLFPSHQASATVLHRNN